MTKSNVFVKLVNFILSVFINKIAGSPNGHYEKKLVPRIKNQIVSKYVFYGQVWYSNFTNFFKVNFELI